MTKYPLNCTVPNVCSLPFLLEEEKKEKKTLLLGHFVTYPISRLDLEGKIILKNIVVSQLVTHLYLLIARRHYYY